MATAVNDKQINFSIFFLGTNLWGASQYERFACDMTFFWQLMRAVLVV